uniref:Glycosyltransferase family 92 protein n=1 Tax=Panagrellus redivivus TaxID=6233 RepID=A0A7E4W7D1_PANRE
MSTKSNDTAIKRFTYDWLIRFAELHPFEVTNPIFEDAPPSKYTAISPLFTTLMVRHKPTFWYYSELRLKHNNMQTRVNPSNSMKRNIIICKFVEFHGHVSDIVAAFIKNRVTCYSNSMRISTGTVSPDDLKYLFKYRNHDKVAILTGVNLTKPMPVTDFWPLIMHCKSILFNMEEFAHGEGIANAIKEYRLCPDELYVSGLDMPKNAVLDVFDSILALPTHPKNVNLRFLQNQTASLARAVIKTYVFSGVAVKHCRPKRPYQTIDYIKQDGLLVGYFH